MKRKKPVITGILVLVFYLVAFAVVAEAADFKRNVSRGKSNSRGFFESIGDEISSWDLQLSCEAKYSYFQYQTRLPYMLNDRREIDLDPGIKWSLSRQTSLLINGNMRYDPDSVSRSRIVPEEMNIAYVGENIDIGFFSKQCG